MSLIHGALKEVEAEAATAGPVPPRGRVTTRRRPVYRMTVAALLTAVLLISVLLLRGWSSAASGLSETEQVAASQGTSMSKPRVEVPVAAVANDPRPVESAKTATNVRVDPPEAPMDAQPPEEAQTHPQSAPSASGVEALKTARVLHQQMIRHLSNQEWGAARAALDRVTVLLPAEHILRLRMEGWLAFKREEDALARSVYERLLRRLPGDAEAAINLASIHLRGTTPGLANGVIERARRHAPDSRMLATASHQLEAVRHE